MDAAILRTLRDSRTFPICRRVRVGAGGVEVQEGKGGCGWDGGAGG